MGTMMDKAELDAFVDGELTPEAAARVVMHLADCPADQAYVDALMEVGTLLAAAYGAPMTEPVPERIQAVIAARSGGAARPGFRLRPRMRGVLALAAAVALVIGIAVRPWEPEPVPADGRIAGPVAPDLPLHAVLERQGSGVPVRTPRNADITVLASFLDRDGRLCREFEIVHDVERSLTHGLACRGGNARWTIEFATSEPLGRGSDAADYQPASGAADAAVTAALDALGAGLSLTPDEESRALSDAWRQ